ncbi:S-adenosyl-L-methionine-dependent methyltransferase [Apiospora arundinis]|uniref:S-adenosyl-L-methionine-dependent methyltransferase n=1 Tax=Apiospora arundinis TaxID=335852 RepID=A0ABR2I233_9PEZI
MAAASHARAPGPSGLRVFDNDDNDVAEAKSTPSTDAMSLGGSSNRSQQFHVPLLLSEMVQSNDDKDTRIPAYRLPQDDPRASEAEAGAAHGLSVPALVAEDIETEEGDTEAGPSCSISNTTTSPGPSTAIPGGFESESMAAMEGTVDERGFTCVLTESGLPRWSTGTSITPESSVLDESGRMYHGYKEGKYLIPNDAEEQDRLDFQHAALTLLLNGNLFLAPLSQVPETVLDVATGTGIWAIEFAEQFPTSTIIGTDLSPIQPTHIPPNCTFIVEDSEEEWLFRYDPSHLPAAATGEPQQLQQQGEEREGVGKEKATPNLGLTFDYIHLRLVVTCFDNPKTVMKHAFDSLNPGGWIEYQDMVLDMGQENPNYRGDAVQRYFYACQKGALAVGRDILCPKNYKEWLEETGFVDVHERILLIPLSPWHDHPVLKEVGVYFLRNAYEGARGFGWKMLRASGLSVEQTESLVAELRKEVLDRDNHSYLLFYDVCGRKPYEGEVPDAKSQEGDQ